MSCDCIWFYIFMHTECRWRCAVALPLFQIRLSSRSHPLHPRLSRWPTRRPQPISMVSGSLVLTIVWYFVMTTNFVVLWSLEVNRISMTTIAICSGNNELFDNRYVSLRLIVCYRFWRRRSQIQFLEGNSIWTQLSPLLSWNVGVQNICLK